MTNKMRISAMALSAAMIVSLFAGCGSAAKQEAAATTASQQDQKKAPVTLTVEVFDRQNAPAGAGSADNNYTTKKLQEMWGTPNNVTLKYVPVPRSQEVDKLNMLMASGSAPNIVFTYKKDLYLQYAKQGGLADLTDLINKTKNLKPLVEVNKADLLYQGKYFAAAAYRQGIDRHMSYIRTDWLQKLGMKAPTTTDEWYNTMKAFKEQDPGKLGGKVIPFGMRATSYVDNHDGAQQLVWSFVKASDEEQQTLPYLALPGFKDGIKFVNKMYNEGLIDPEFALDQDQKNFKANIVNGRIGFITVDTITPYQTGEGDLLENLQKNVPGANLEPIECFKNADGKYLKSTYPHNGWYIMVPKTSKPEEVQAAVNFMDWMSSEEALKFVLWGEDGKNYTLKDGITTISAEQKAVNDKDRFNVGDLSLMWNGYYNPNMDLIYKQIEASDLKWGKQMAAATKLAEKDGFRDYNSNPAFDTAIDAASKYQANLDKLYLDGLAKAIMAKPADFDKTYDALLADYLKNGGQEIIDQKKAAYKAMHK